MKNSLTLRTVASVLLAGATLTLTACTPNVEGTYSDPNGDITIELKSGGEAKVKFFHLGGPCTYEVKGKDVAVTCNGTTTHYTVKDDGSLAGSPMVGMPDLKKVK